MQTVPTSPLANDLTTAQLGTVIVDVTILMLISYLNNAMAVDMVIAAMAAAFSHNSMRLTPIGENRDFNHNHMSLKIPCMMHTHLGWSEDRKASIWDDHFVDKKIPELVQTKVKI